jgi:hypothetical protein
MGTKRSWNWWLWAGFGLVLAGLLTYIPFFAQFPPTRDVPWVNFLMFAAGGALLGVGLVRAFRRRDQYRGRVFGSVLSVLALAGIGLFLFVVFHFARQLPASAGAPHVGQRAPEFVLNDQDGKPVALADLIAPPAKGALLIFYRGYW